MRTLTINLKQTGGDDFVGQSVVVKLVSAEGKGFMGATDTGVIVSSDITKTTDENGVATFVLTPNELFKNDTTSKYLLTTTGITETFVMPDKDMDFFELLKEQKQ